MLIRELMGELSLLFKRLMWAGNHCRICRLSSGYASYSRSLPVMWVYFHWCELLCHLYEWSKHRRHDFVWLRRPIIVGDIGKVCSCFCVGWARRWIWQFMCEPLFWSSLRGPSALLPVDWSNPHILYSVEIPPPYDWVKLIFLSRFR